MQIELEEVEVEILPDGRMNRKNAAKYLGCRKNTLAIWHSQGKGPKCVKIGGLVFYFKSDIDAFIKEGI